MLFEWKKLKSVQVYSIDKRRRKKKNVVDNQKMKIERQARWERTESHNAYGCCLR